MIMPMNKNMKDSIFIVKIIFFVVIGLFIAAFHIKTLNEKQNNIRVLKAIAQFTNNYPKSLTEKKSVDWSNGYLQGQLNVLTGEFYKTNSPEIKYKRLE